MTKQKRTPKVGVALLAYNQGQYVDDAIESLKKQTFQDFEVYLADDGSNDGITANKLKTLEYDKITKRIIDGKNLGNAKRRRQLHSIIKNDYMIDFCGDDILAPEFLEKLVCFLDKNPKYGAVCTNVKMFRSDVDVNSLYSYDKNKMKLPDMLVTCNILGSSLVRRKALDGIDLEWPLKRRYDWNKFIAMLKKGWKLGLVEEPLFYYRQVDNSLSHLTLKEDDVAFMKELMKRYPDEFEKNYKEIICLLCEKYAELQGGKNWLEQQYHNLNEEIDRLNGVIEDLNETNSRLMIKRRIKRFLKKLIAKEEER